MDKTKKDIKKICPLCNNDGEIVNIIDAQPLFYDNNIVNKTYEKQQSRTVEENIKNSIIWML